MRKPRWLLTVTVLAILVTLVGVTISWRAGENVQAQEGEKKDLLYLPSTLRDKLKSYYQSRYPEYLAPILESAICTEAIKQFDADNKRLRVFVDTSPKLETQGDLDDKTEFCFFTNDDDLRVVRIRVDGEQSIYRFDYVKFLAPYRKSARSYKLVWQRDLNDELSIIAFRGSLREMATKASRETGCNAVYVCRGNSVEVDFAMQYVSWYEALEICAKSAGLKINMLSGSWEHTYVTSRTSNVGSESLSSAKIAAKFSAESSGELVAQALVEELKASCVSLEWRAKSQTLAITEHTPSRK